MTQTFTGGVRRADHDTGAHHEHERETEPIRGRGKDAYGRQGRRKGQDSAPEAGTEAEQIAADRARLAARVAGSALYIGAILATRAISHWPGVYALQVGLFAGAAVAVLLPPWRRAIPAGLYAGLVALADPELVDMAAVCAVLVVGGWRGLRVLDIGQRSMAVCDISPRVTDGVAAAWGIYAMAEMLAWQVGSGYGWALLYFGAALLAAWGAETMKLADRADLLRCRERTDAARRRAAELARDAAKLEQEIEAKGESSRQARHKLRVSLHLMGNLLQGETMRIRRIDPPAAARLIEKFGELRAEIGELPKDEDSPMLAYMREVAE